MVIDIPGLTMELLEGAPKLKAIGETGFALPMEGVFPAVTCPVQATLVTGTMPRDHGIVGNGWYFRDLCEVHFWKQPEALVWGEKIWEEARKKDPSFSCAKLFWWFNMYSSADVAVTPRPVYGSAGQKIPDLWTKPRDLREELQEKFGPFPLFNFWGPKADLKSTKWIVDSTIYVLENRSPSMILTYLPHLDYDFQRYGPEDSISRKALKDLDREAGRLASYARAQGFEVVVVSEYGIEPVSGTVYINRFLREAGYLEIRETKFGELLDFGASKAFAVADHQVAHVYVADPKERQRLGKLLSELPGVETVLDGKGKQRMGIDHERAGELVLVAEKGRWFAYPWWLDDDMAPDFAQTVDIHRKPGYDPVELFSESNFKGWVKLLLKKLGFRVLINVVPLDAGLVSGSHGRPAEDPSKGPILVCSNKEAEPEKISALGFKSWLLSLVFS